MILFHFVVEVPVVFLHSDHEPAVRHRYHVGDHVEHGDHVYGALRAE